MSKGDTLANQAEIIREMLTQKDKMIKDLFELVETLENDLNEAYEEIEGKGPAAPRSSNAFGPVVGYGQD
jgi:hypothetical protein